MGILEQAGSGTPQPGRQRMMGTQMGMMGTQMGMKQTFPANQDDVAKFKLDIIKAIHSEQQQQQIVQALQSGQRIGIGATIGQLAGGLVMMIVQRRVHEQGVKIQPRLAIMGTAMAIKEIANIANAIGMQVTEQDMQQAVQVAEQIIMETGNGRAGNTR